MWDPNFPAVEEESLNRWTAREVLQRSFLIWYNENKVWVNFRVHLYFLEKLLPNFNQQPKSSVGDYYISFFSLK